MNRFITICLMLMEQRYEKTEIQERVAKQFAALREDWWTVVDASQSFDQVELEIRAAAETAVKKCANGEAPIRHLW